MAWRFGVIKIPESTLKGKTQGSIFSVGTITSTALVLPVFSGVDKTVRVDGDAEDLIVNTDYFIGYMYDDTGPNTTYNIRAVRGDTDANNFPAGTYLTVTQIGIVQIAYAEGREMITEIVHFFATT